MKIDINLIFNISTQMSD